MRDTSIECHCLVVMLNMMMLVLDVISGLVCFISAIVLVAITTLDDHYHIASAIVGLVVLYNCVSLLGLHREADYISTSTTQE
jgi:Na+/alanine symporter